MRAVLATYGSRGDVEPIVALAVEMRKSGADVTVCIPPDNEFVALANRANVPAVMFPKAWKSWAGEATTAEEAVVSVDDYVGGYIAATFDTLLAAVRDCDVVLASGMLHFIGQSVADLCRVPYRFALFSPNLLQPQGWQELARAPIDAHRAALGLTAIGDMRTFLFTRVPWLAADPVLAPADAGLSHVRTGTWMRPDERPLPRALLRFLDAGPPPVYVGFGSMRVPAAMAEVALAAIRAHGYRAIIGRGWAGLTARAEDGDCIAVDDVNQQVLFPRVAAAIHHGGAGTSFVAARSGVPQVIVPQSASDQFYWAERIASLGIGVAHDGPVPTADMLTRALATALSPSCRERAGVVRGMIRSDGAAEAARLVNEMSASSGSRGA